MQGKIDCNKINKIREERNANLIYTGSSVMKISGLEFCVFSYSVDKKLCVYIGVIGVLFRREHWHA